MLNVHDDVHGAVDHLGHAGCSFGDGTHYDAVNFRLFSPIGGVLFQDDFLISFPAHENVGTCADGITADGFLANLFAVGGGKHRNFRKVLDEEDVRRGKDEFHGQLVHRFIFGDVFFERIALAREFLRGGAFEVPDCGFGIKGFTV